MLILNLNSERKFPIHPLCRGLLTLTSSIPDPWNVVSVYTINLKYLSV